MMPADTGDRRVLLAAMPLASALFPSLALGLLKAAVAACDVACDVHYFSLDYVERIGREEFDRLHDHEHYIALLGEWIFADAALGRTAGRGDANGEPFGYLTTILQAECPEQFSAALVRSALAARSDAAAFVESCFDAVDWSRYAILGLSSSFQQNMASLALARRVKDRHPHVLIVFGGPNCAGDMGEELHRQYSFIDVVCLGEGDRVFPALVSSYLAGRGIPELPGIVRRGADGGTVPPHRAVDQIEDLDQLPYPDHSDFYQQHAALSETAHYPPAAVFETARGCWWGAKNHCTFCGINGRSMSFRSKSQTRAYDELVHLVAACGSDVVVTDAILDLDYFKELLPRLAASGPFVTAFWQMKANLRPEWLPLLARAGVMKIQPGIEALDTELLTLMRKGCTMLQNVQTLKLAAEAGMLVAWNLLYGFPGESPSSYARTTALIPKLRHLQPPSNTGRVLADRFSPYFQRPEDFGVTLEPAAAYGHVYPFNSASVRHLAYHFHLRSETLLDIEAIVAPMKAEQRLWSDHHPASALYYEDDGTEVAVTDRRWGWGETNRLYQGPEALLLRLCGTIATWPEVCLQSSATYPEALMMTAADRLVDAGIVLRDGRELLALPLRKPGRQRAPTFEEVLAARRRVQWTATPPDTLMGTPVAV